MKLIALLVGRAAEARFSVDRMVDQYLAVYDALRAT
jgi:hypothetical protein